VAVVDILQKVSKLMNELWFWLTIFVDPSTLLIDTRWSSLSIRIAVLR